MMGNKKLHLQVFGYDILKLMDIKIIRFCIWSTFMRIGFAINERNCCVQNILAFHSFPQNYIEKRKVISVCHFVYNICCIFHFMNILLRCSLLFLYTVKYKCTRKMHTWRRIGCGRNLYHFYTFPVTLLKFLTLYERL